MTSTSPVPEIPQFKSETLEEKPLPPNVLAYVYFDEKYEGGSTRRVELDNDYIKSQHIPNAITSRMMGLDGHRQNVIDEDDEYHRPILDIDLPVMLIPSSTPDHYHLYIDAPMKWGAYKKLLSALSGAGIIEEGYYKASVSRRASYLRLPGVKKGDEYI